VFLEIFYSIFSAFNPKWIMIDNEDDEIAKIIEKER